MGPHINNAETPLEEKYDMSTTRAASRKEGRFCKEICRLGWVRNLGISLAMILIVTQYATNAIGTENRTICIQHIYSEMNLGNTEAVPTARQVCRQAGKQNEQGGSPKLKPKAGKVPAQNLCSQNLDLNPWLFLKSSL